MDELTPEQKQKLLEELTKYAKEGASDNDLRTFRASLISQFENQNNASVKKKETSSSIGQMFGKTSQEGGQSTDSISSLRAEVGGQTEKDKKGVDFQLGPDAGQFSDNVGQSAVSKIATTGLKNIVATHPEDIIVPISGDQSIRIIKGEGATELITPTGNAPLIKVLGEPIPVWKESLPKGFTDPYAYAADFKAREKAALSTESESEANDKLNVLNAEIQKISALNQMRNNKYVVTNDDLEGINKYLKDERGLFYDKATPEVIQRLKDKKNKIISDARIKFEEDSDNFRYDNKTGKKIFTKDFNAPSTSEIDSYIEKSANSIQQEVRGLRTGVPVLSADVSSDLSSFLRSPGGQIADIKSRFHNETLNSSFFTGLESLKYKDEQKYQMYLDRLNSGKTLSSAIVADLTNSGANIIKARELENLAADKIDINAYTQKESEVNKELEDNFYNREDILQKSISNIIAEYHANKGRTGVSRFINTVFGEWQITDKEIDEVPAEWFAEKGIDITKPQSKAAIQNIKDNEGFLPFDNAVQKDGLSRELLKGAASPLKGVSNFFGNIGAGDNEKLLQRELEPIANYSQKRTEYFNKHYGMLADAVNGLGQFATQYLLMEAGIGAVKGVGLAAGGSEASLLLRSPESFTGTMVRQGSKVGNKILDKSQLVGQLAIPYIQSYDDYYKSALEKTDNPLTAKVYAFLNAGMESVSEKIFDNVKFGRDVIKNFSGSQINMNKLAKIFDRGVFDNVAQKEFREMVEGGLKNSIKIISEGTKGLAKESFEEVPVALTNFITDAMANPQSIDGRDVFGEMKDAFVSGMVSFSIPSLLGIGGKFKQQFKNNTTQEDALMVAAKNRNDVLDAIYNQAEDGIISQEEVNHKIKVLNTASSALKNIPNYVDGSRMDESDRVKYLGLTVQEKFIKEETSKIDDEAVKKSNEEKISEINKQKFDILSKSANEEDRLNKLMSLSKTPEQKAAVQKEIDAFSEKSKNEKIFTDFDETVWDNKTQSLTPLGEQLKAKIEAGADVTVLTSSSGERTDNGAKVENEQFISDKLGISTSKIISGLKPSEKASHLVPGATYYENNDAALFHAKNRLGVNVIDSKNSSTIETSNENKLSDEENKISKEEIRAANILGQAELPEFYMKSAEEDPVGTLRDIAHQAQGIVINTETGKQELDKGGARADDLLRMGVPQSVIDKAIAMFPAEQKADTVGEDVTDQFAKTEKVSVGGYKSALGIEDIANQEAAIEVAKQDAVVEAGKPQVEEKIQDIEVDDKFFIVKNKKGRIDGTETAKKKNAFNKRKQQLTDRYEALKKLIDC